MTARAFLRWPWASTLLVGVVFWTFILTAAGGEPGAWPPVWLTALAAMTPAVAIANVAASLLAPASPAEEVPHE